MSPTKNSAGIFNSVPKEYPVLGETIILGIAQLTSKTFHLRGDYSSKLYIYPLIHIYGGGCERAPEHSIRVIKLEPGIPLSAYIGVLGMPGRDISGPYTPVKPHFTGWRLLENQLKGKPYLFHREQALWDRYMVILAKAKGLKVIASVGLDEKVNFLKSIGVDVASNYKKDTIASVLAKEGPIDIYWDNVGSSTLETALDACNTDARVVPYAIKNMTNVLFKRLRIEGLFVTHGEEQYEGGLNNPTKSLDALAPLIQSVQIKWSEQVYKGIESVGEAIIAVQTGSNTAKVVIEV
ncbi:hypothetical protein B0J17DRAFT_709114 [Rhizoctonia solani]|nr:hypothetical protein B0J17DRAFT_709114 [Rhizoctonia solani]